MRTKSYAGLVGQAEANLYLTALDLRVFLEVYGDELSAKHYDLLQEISDKAKQRHDDIESSHP